MAARKNKTDVIRKNGKGGQLMGILHEKVVLTHELKRQHMIQQLMDLGITEDGGVPVQELDYYSVRHLLALARIRNE
jgi:hypothetical protein